MYRSVEVSSPILCGHFQTDIFGKNVVIDGVDGIRVYNLPVERTETVQINNDRENEEEVVDDWEQLTIKKEPAQTLIIRDSYDLDFNLLKDYVPLKDGGNKVSFNGKIRDRTAGMRWLIQNYEKLKCENGTRLFDVDFFAGKFIIKKIYSEIDTLSSDEYFLLIKGNGALRSIMTSQFSQYEEVAHIAVILFKGTYYMFDVDPTDEKESEMNNKRSFAGLRFEDFASRGRDGKEYGPSTGEQNNYNDSIKYYNVVKFNFDTFKMLLSGEVDCMLPSSSAANGKKPKAQDFIELKTSLPLENKYDHKRMSRVFRCGKVSTWFAQCALMGMKHIVVGIREEEDECEAITVKRTQAFTLEELRQNSNGFWSKNRCFDDLKKFLHFVKEKVTVDDPETINVFIVKGGIISEPQKKKLADDIAHFPDVSEVVELMENLSKDI